VGQGYGKVSWSVRAIWENYAGWFHHRSTTELYAVPPSSVHADLVELAGGPAAVAARASDKLANGQPIEAIYLAETALTADSKSLPALEVMIAAHERLESESENFWLTKWLRKELDNESTLCVKVDEIKRRLEKAKAAMLEVEAAQAPPEPPQPTPKPKPKPASHQEEIQRLMREIKVHKMVEDVPGGGARFVVSLPSSRAQAA